MQARLVPPPQKKNSARAFEWRFFCVRGSRLIRAKRENRLGFSEGWGGRWTSCFYRDMVSVHCSAAAMLAALASVLSSIGLFFVDPWVGIFGLGLVFLALVGLAYSGFFVPKDVDSESALSIVDHIRSRLASSDRLLAGFTRLPRFVRNIFLRVLSWQFDSTSIFSEYDGIATIRCLFPDLYNLIDGEDATFSYEELMTMLVDIVRNPTESESFKHTTVKRALKMCTSTSLVQIGDWGLDPNWDDLVATVVLVAWSLVCDKPVLLVGVAGPSNVRAYRCAVVVLMLSEMLKRDVTGVDGRMFIEGTQISFASLPDCDCLPFMASTVVFDQLNAAGMSNLNLNQIMKGVPVVYLLELKMYDTVMVTGYLSNKEQADLLTLIKTSEVRVCAQTLKRGNFNLPNADSNLIDQLACFDGSPVPFSKSVAKDLFGNMYRYVTNISLLCMICSLDTKGPMNKIGSDGKPSSALTRAMQLHFDTPMEFVRFHWCLFQMIRLFLGWA